MNNKDFKSSYNQYIQNVKPSQQLIDSTIKLAHQHEEALRSQKANSTNNALRMLSNLDVKRYSALACTVVFALVAVKVWGSLSKEEIPTLPKDTTAQTTTIEEYQGSQEFTTASENLEYPEYTTSVTNFESDTNNLNSYTTIDYEQYIDTLTATPNQTTNVSSSNLYSQDTTTETNVNTSNANENAIVTTVPTSTTENTNSMGSHNNNHHTTTTKSTNTTTKTTTSKSTTKATTTAPKTTTNNNTNSVTTTSTTKTTSTTTKNTTVTNTNTNTTTTTRPKETSTITTTAPTYISTVPITTAPVEHVTVTTNTTTSVPNLVTTATLPIDINTTINTFPTETLPVTTAFATTLTEIKEETATSTPRKVRPIFTINPDDDNSNADVSINVSSPEDYPETTSHDNDVAIATITTPHEDEVATVTTINGENNVSVGEIYTTTYPTNNDSVNVDNSVSEAKIYLVLKVVLYPNEDGFYYDGTTYPDRIINSFSFGEYITGIIPLDTYNETYHGYEHLFIIDLKNLYQDETLSTSNILSEIRQCEYMYYQPIDTRFTTMDTTNLDFNNNGIDASSDEEDRNTLLSIIYR